MAPPEMLVLALLADGPRTGYELKKLLFSSESLPWSGNNNQVYTTLVKLHRDGLAEYEEQAPVTGPPRKMYALTDRGRAALREWLLEGPAPPEVRYPVLVHLVGADLLGDDELARLLVDYEASLRLRLLGLDELERRGTGPSSGSIRQRLLWRAINGRALGVVRDELRWVEGLRWELSKLQMEAGQ